MTEWMRGNMLEKRKAGGDLGGTMRLGAYECDVTPGSLDRRHLRQDPDQRAAPAPLRGQHQLQGPAGRGGLNFSGMSPDGVLPEMVEIPGHPWFVGVQFHPELKSRLFEPHPLFTSFIGAAADPVAVGAPSSSCGLDPAICAAPEQMPGSSPALTMETKRMAKQRHVRIGNLTARQRPAVRADRRPVPAGKPRACA